MWLLFKMNACIAQLYSADRKSFAESSIAFSIIVDALMNLSKDVFHDNGFLLEELICTLNVVCTRHNTTLYDLKKRCDRVDIFSTLNEFKKLIYWIRSLTSVPLLCQCIYLMINILIAWVKRGLDEYWNQKHLSFIAHRCICRLSHNH